MILSTLKWIQEWYLQNCDGDWEHCNGINISTLDNPGWMVDIDLSDTNLEEREFQVVDIERNDCDWVYCNVSDNIFHGNGGPNNLEEILIIFQNWVGKT